MSDKIRQAEEAFATGRLEEAKTILQSILQEDPRHTEAYNNLGVIAWQQGDLRKAISHLGKALEIDPQYKDALVNFAVVLNTQERHADILDLLRASVSRPDVDEELLALFRQAQQARSRQLAEAKNAYRQQMDGMVFSDEKPLGDAKVLLAPMEIAGVMGRGAKILRDRGIDATSATYVDSWLQYRCDIHLALNGLPEQQQMQRINTFAKEAMDRYDIFHYHFARSLYPDLRDLKELKERGKKILFSFLGSDSRAFEVILYRQAKFLGYQPPKPFFHSLEQYATIRTINRYADVLLGYTCIPRYRFIPGMIDTDQWDLDEKRRCLDQRRIEKDPRKTYFLHAPSTKWKKGSSIIMKALKLAKKRGLPIEILYVSEKAPEEAKQIYAYADVAIDQVSVGTFGLFGIEMMCWEIPVIVYQTEYYDRLRDYPPILKIKDQSDLEQTIEKCVAMKASGELDERGKQGRQWVLSHVDMRKGMDELIEIYQQLVRDQPVLQYPDQGWFQQEEKILNGEKSDFYRYMQQQGAFSAIGVQISSYDKRLYT